jgi:hypothetical protein
MSLFLNNRQPIEPAITTTEIISNETEFTINDTNYHRYDNVIHYKYELIKHKLTVETMNNIVSDITNIYFVFDCPGEDALAHWLYESFMFYPLYSELKKIYPTLQILTSNKKKYVKNLLIFFGLDDNIIYQLDKSHKNTCIFPPIISLNELRDEEIFKKYINIYEQSVKIRLNMQKPNKYLFLPRNTVDNYVINDRTIPFTEEIRTKIIEYGGSVLNTYEINNLTFQFNIVLSSEVIIVDYGSSFFFNCIFLENKTILLLHNIYLEEYLLFPANRILYSYINSRNKLFLFNIEIFGASSLDNMLSSLNNILL